MSVLTTVIDIESDPQPSLANQIAQAVAGIGTIGQAQQVLEAAGWQARITANHITVNQEVVADYVSINGSAWWQVYACDGSLPVFVVGSRTQPANWVGAE